MSKYFSKRWKDNQYYSVESHIINKLTIEQLEQLGKKNSSVKSDNNFIGTLFKKVHHIKLDPERIADLTFEERRAELLEMYESAKNHPQSLKTSLLHEIIENGVKLDIFDEKLFLDYIKVPMSTWFLNSHKYKNSYQDGTWNNYIGAIQMNYGSVQYEPQSKLYYTYLEAFYRNQDGDLKKFQEHFDETWWKQTITKIEFLAGKDLKSLDTNTGIDFEQLAKKVEIELL